MAFTLFALLLFYYQINLVNFIGVPLSGYDSYLDYKASGGGDPEAHMMGALNRPASTPVYFLAAAGVVMIIALATSRKARKVVDTTVRLARQDSGDEMFGSSRLARMIVRLALGFSEWILRHTPRRLRRWIDRRLDPDEAILENNAAFDLVRGSINLVLAGALIALGTSLKLPLSTTYVTFMVAMGTSLSDRAWGRESAVFRITGVISVIGGWFITAGAAFIGAGLIVSLMHVGGTAAIVLTAMVAIFILIRSNFFHKEKEEPQGDLQFGKIMECGGSAEGWILLKRFMADRQESFMAFALEMQREVTEGFFTESCKRLGKAVSGLAREKIRLKNDRRKTTLCFRQMPQDIAIEKSAWFYLAGNSQMAILYNLRRIADVCHEHVDNNFQPLPAPVVCRGRLLCSQVAEMMETVGATVGEPELEAIMRLREACNRLKSSISGECRKVQEDIRRRDVGNMAVLYVYLNMMQEQQEIVSNLRKLLRADYKLMTLEPKSLTASEHPLASAAAPE